MKRRLISFLKMNVVRVLPLMSKATLKMKRCLTRAPIVSCVKSLLVFLQDDRLMISEHWTHALKLWTDIYIRPNTQLI